MNRRLVLVLLGGFLSSSVFMSKPAAQQDPAFVPGELLVQFRAIAPPMRRTAILAEQGANEIQRFDAVGISQIRLDSGRDLVAVLAALRAFPEVAAADLNFVRSIGAPAPQTEPNDPFFTDGTLYGMHRISAPATWAAFGTGNGSVVVADLDTGVNYDHADLAANMWRNPGEVAGNGIDDDANGYIDDVFGIDARNNDGDPMDDNGHGTHTAGTIAGVGNNGIGVAGVVWNAKVLACKFLNAQGNGNDGDAIECFNYLIDQRNRGANIRVSSNSWGSGRGNGSDSGPLKNAIDAAGAAGILNVFAAGNSNLNNDSFPFDPASYSSPSIISVAASDSADAKAGFSSYGATSVDLAAPGVNIVSSYIPSGYAASNGTSMATPHVAGAAVLLAGLNPSLTVAQLKQAILSTVDTLPQWSGIVASGGRLNVHTASGAATGNLLPVITLTSPANGAQYEAPATIPFAATASDSDGWINNVEFFANGVSVGVLTSSPYAGQWLAVPAGSYSLTAVATDNGGRTRTSASHLVVVTTPGGSNATYLGADTTSQGDWLGRYGSQGYSVAGDTTSFPAWANLTVAPELVWTWATSTSDPRALQRSSGNGRVMASWYGAAFDVTVRLTDGQPHKVAIHVADFDNGGRSQRIEAFDANTGQLFASQTLSSFSDGRYLVYRVTGDVRFRVTGLTGPNALVSGLFVDPDGPIGNNPPTVTLTWPADGLLFSAPANIPVAANANDSDGTVTSVEFFANGNSIGTDTTSPYSKNWSIATPGTYLLTAVATDDDGATKTSAGNTVQITGSTAASATVLGIDSSTQGNWIDHFGSEGYRVVNDTSSFPAYAQVTPSGHSTWEWASSTSDPRALQRASGSGRVMASWYGGAFDVRVRLTDGQPHRVAIHCADWDPWGRAQRIDAFDVASGQLIATQTMSNFSGGAYVLWRVTGDVRFRFTSTAGPNAVISGIFLDPDGAPLNNPPTVSLSGPADSATFVAPADITVSANASDSDGTVTSVQFFQNGTPIGTDSSAPFSVDWNDVTPGTYVLTAVATDDDGATRTSASRTIVVTAPGGGTSASVVAVDTSTQGDWIGRYGSQGHNVVGDTLSHPAYAQVTVSGVSSWTWATSTTDPRALQRASGSGRVMASWYGGAFDITVRLTDGQPHQVAIHAADWDPWGRAQRIDAYDAITGQPLATHIVSNFSGGEYIVWRLVGEVRFRITATAGPNAVVSGLFFDPDGPPGNLPPTVSLTSPASDASFQAGSNITVSADANDSDGSVTSVEFRANGNPIGTDSSAPFSIAWNSVPAGTYVLTAVATDDDGATRTSTGRTVVVTAAGGATAVLLGVDTATQGNWIGQYGGEGYAVVGDTTSLPAFAQVTAFGHSTWTWSTSTSDARALLRASGTDRVMASWYNSSFDITVRLTGGQAHLFAIHSADWDPWGRGQRIDAYDADTGQLLATHSSSSFAGGEYVKWRISGNVRFRLTVTAGPNAVVSGLFFDVAPSGEPPNADVETIAAVPVGARRD